jgi:hypothetical protein
MEDLPAPGIEPGTESGTAAFDDAVDLEGFIGLSEGNLEANFAASFQPDAPARASLARRVKMLHT